MSELADMGGSLADAELAKLEAREEAKRRLAEKTRGSFRLDILNDIDQDAVPTAQWLVHELILDGSNVQLIGEPGVYKSFLALDLSLSICAGFGKWLGRKLNKTGAVVYVVGEGAGRFNVRKRLWKQERGVTSTLPFYVLLRPVDLRDGAMMADFLAKLDALKPTMVVFDTLARCLPGTEENSAKELGEAIRACDVIRESLGATVLLLHHPRKDGLSARGSGAGLGAVDTELWLKRGTDAHLVQLTVGKQKEGDDSVVLDLERRIVELDGVLDDHGEPITSCVLNLASPGALASAVNKLDRRILEFVEKNPGCSRTAVYQYIGGKEKPIRDAIDRLVSLDQELDELKKGKASRLTRKVQP